MTNNTVCRFCGSSSRETFVDLGMSPLCESYLPAEQLESRWSRSIRSTSGCARNCFLVQLDDTCGAEHIFTEYAYFSSFSTAWLKHAEDYVAMISDRLDLDPKSLVVELASNDGYLLQYFVKRGIPCLGIEPAANVAKVAVAKGVRDAGDVLRRASWRASSPPKGGRPIWCSATTCSPRCRTSTISSPASRRPEADRHVHHRVPAPACG